MCALLPGICSHSVPLPGPPPRTSRASPEGLQAPCSVVGSVSRGCGPQAERGPSQGGVSAQDWPLPFSRRPVPVPLQSLVPKKEGLGCWDVSWNTSPSREAGVPSGDRRRRPQLGSLAPQSGAVPRALGGRALCMHQINKCSQSGVTANTSGEQVEDVKVVSRLPLTPA